MFFVKEKFEIDEDKIISIVKSICLMCVQSCKHKVRCLINLIF